MTYEHVLRPIDVGPVRLPNRVVRTAHGTGSLARGGFNPEHIAYHEARARGGFGLSVLEAASVHPSSRARLRAWDAAIVDGYRALMAAVRPTGMRVMQQLYHAGHHMAPPDGSPPWSASDVPSVRLGIAPPGMSVSQIHELVEGFAIATRHARAGGLHGVEIHAAHGYLVHQFLSPLTNRRTDAYGGDAARRARLLWDVLGAVRREAGDEMAVGVRLSATEYAEGGLGPDDVAALARDLEAAGLVDFVDVSVGEYRRFDKVIGAMHEPAGYQLEASAVVTAAVALPTIVAGRLTTLQQADDLVAGGITDLVAMVRASIADPDLVEKSRSGRADEVRPCIGCNQGCLAGMVTDRLGCVVNPQAGRETTSRSVPVSTPALRRSRKVLVLGGGPAGMEAARVAAERGLRVQLVEADRELGGQLRLAARAPFRSDIAAFTNWAARELSRLRVDVTLGVRADGAMLSGLDAGTVVVVAIGSRPRRDGFQCAAPGLVVPGVEAPHVVTSREVLGEEAPSPQPAADHAVVLDDLGHYEAVAAAEYLLQLGWQTTLVTRHDRVAPLLEDAAVAQPARARLGERGLHVMTSSLLLEVADGRCVVGPVQGSARRELAADLVVLVSGSLPLPDPAGQGDRPFQRHVVGDARAPRYLARAVAEGQRAAAVL